MKKKKQKQKQKQEKKIWLRVDETNPHVAITKERERVPGGKTISPSLPPYLFPKLYFS